MRRNPVLVLVLLALALGLMVPSGLAQFRQSTQLNLTPESFTITSGGSLTFTVTLLSDGKPLAGKTITFSATLGIVDPPMGVTDANGKVSFVYTAPQTPVRIYVNITATFAGDLLYEGSTAVASGVVEPAPSLTLPSISLIGASFTVPEMLKDDVFSYRNSIPSDVMKMLPTGLPSEAFLLATNESLYLVFAEQSDKGLAEVKGWLLPTPIKLAGLNISVVVAKSVIFMKEGSPTTLSEILANPEAYKFKLVKVDAYRRQISVLYDSDEPPYIEFPLTIGYLSEKPIEPLTIVRKALEKAKEIIFRIDDGVIRDLLELREPQILWVFNFEYEYWFDSKVVTNGIVIPPNHPIFTLFELSMPVLGSLLKASGPIILYDVKTDLLYEGVQSVVELKENSERYLGKVVKLTANCYGGYISVQEVIEHNTPCGEDLVYVQNVGCVNLVIDVRLEGFTAWNDVSVPPRREQLLLAAGVSSFHQDEQFVEASGVFELIGKVVSTRGISDSLPEDIALIIYSARKVDEVDFERLAAQVKDEVKDKVGELHWALQDIYPYQKPPEIPFKIPRKVFWPKALISVTTPKELPEIVVDRNFTVRIDVANAPINLNISNSLISNVSIRLREIVRNVTIYFEKLIEKPPEVPSPPGLVYAYHKIDVNVPEASIEKAGITFWVLKEWLATRGATKDDVVILRYHGGEWSRLPTRAIDENATHFKFVAETPGFSIFAIIVPTEVETGVEGYVLDNVTGEPIRGAKIIALPEVITLVRVETTTDDMGHYLISLTPGSYVLVVSANSYADMSTEVSLALGEVKRTDFRLERALAEFSENWYGARFEITLVGNPTWEIGDNASIKVSATVSDMGENQKIEFRQLKLELALTGVKVSVPINLATSIGGTVFSKPIIVRVLDGFSLHAPGETKGYSLQVALEGSVVDKFGIERPGLALKTISVNIYAPESPVSIELAAPPKVKIGDEFDVKLRLRNEGKHPISDLKVSLSLPFGTSAIGPTETTIKVVNSKEVAEAVFRLRAEIPATSSIIVTYYYKTLWGHFASEPLKTLGSITITKIPVSLTISVEPREVSVGEEVVVKGSISPAMSKTIELTIKRPDGTTDTQVTTSTPDGGFGFKVKLDREGEWSFVARFAGDPTYEEVVSAEVRATAKPKPGPCIIATAAFGTELDPHVQHLRGFRDGIVLRTFAGSSFMNVFNAWYYSWSPYVASAMQACEPLRQTVKYVLYPLIGILHVSEALYGPLSFSPEVGVTVVGIITSFLIGLVYFAPPSIVVMRLTGRWPSKKTFKLAALVWLTAITGTGLSVVAGSSVAAMAFTSTLVLASLVSSIMLTARLIMVTWRPLKS